MEKSSRVWIAVLGPILALAVADLGATRLRTQTSDPCVWLGEVADRRLGLVFGDVLTPADSAQLELRTGAAWDRWARWEQVVGEHETPGACLAGWARVRVLGVPRLRLDPRR
jgi:hypothetical protein